MKTENKITTITDDNELQKAYQVANTIFQQIKYTAGSIMLCWGISKKSVARYNGKNGLFLLVNGFAHKGIVGIVLNEGKDLYEIHLFKSASKKNEQGLKTTYWECIKSLDEVFCEDLGLLIDELVEKPANVTDKQYSEQVNKAFYKAIFE